MKTNKENQEKALIKNIVDAAVNFGTESLQFNVALSVPKRIYNFTQLNAFIGKMTIALHNAGVKLPGDNI